MTDTYVVVAEVSGLDDGRHEPDERRAKRLKRDSEAALDVLRRQTALVGEYIRDDGSAELLFEWDPDEEADGTRTFQEAKPSLEHVRSSIQGAGLSLDNPLRVELRDVTKASSRK